MTLTELLELYIAKRLRLASKNTLRLYRHSIKSFEKTLGRQCTVDDLTDDNLERHMSAVVNAGRSRATANKDCAQISAIWRWANRNDLTKTWPNVRKLTEPERVPLGWLPHEMEAIFASIEKETGKVFTVPAKLWWRALISVLLDTGERIGPMRQLSRDALQGNHLHVPAELRKRGTRDKLYQLCDDTVADLKEILRLHNKPNLFAWDRSETYVYYRYTAILKRAGLSHDSRSKFHRIRRLVASAVKRMGGDPTAALDHSSPRITKTYLDPRIVGEVPTSELMKRYRRNG